jgi:uncharacterized iron-regulated membrane protein
MNFIADGGEELATQPDGKLGAHFARISWDLHSALGFWCFVFVLVWGVSGIYFLPRVV